MNDTFMIRTTPNDGDSLSTDKIRLELKPKLSNELDLTNEQQREKTPPSELVLPSVDHDITVCKT